MTSLFEQLNNAVENVGTSRNPSTPQEFYDYFVDYIGKGNHSGKSVEKIVVETGIKFGINLLSKRKNNFKEYSLILCAYSDALIFCQQERRKRRSRD